MFRFLHVILSLFLVLVPSFGFAWTGFDYQTGNYVEIDQGTLVRRGLDIIFYDYGTGEYHDGAVEGITQIGNEIELEIYDYTLGEYRYIYFQSN